MGVPLFDTTTPLAPLRGQIADAVAGVIDDGRFILGPNVKAFEQEFADYCGAAHAVGVANGTDALTIALRAMGVGPGDDVIVPSFTFYASAEAIPPAGARPVFCDVDPDTMCITAETVKAALTPRTKAVVAVHLFGNVAPVAEIEALGVPVLEDAAQSAGSTTPGGRPGALGTAATFSFFPSKDDRHLMRRKTFVDDGLERGLLIQQASALFDGAFERVLRHRGALCLLDREAEPRVGRRVRPAAPRRHHDLFRELGEQPAFGGRALFSTFLFPLGAHRGRLAQAGPGGA
jgi:hypothetical protein